MLTCYRQLAQLYVTSGDYILMRAAYPELPSEMYYHPLITVEAELNRENNLQHALEEMLESNSYVRPDMLLAPRLRYVMLRRRRGLISSRFVYFAELRPECRLESMARDFVDWNLIRFAFLLPMESTASQMMRHYGRIGHKNQCLYLAEMQCGAFLFKRYQVEEDA